MLASLVLIMALADLLLDFLGDQVDGGVKVLFEIFRKQVRAGKRESYRTGKLPLGRFGLVMFERDPRVDGTPVQVLQFVDSADNVIFNGFSQSHVMGREDQVHNNRMQPIGDKIQRKYSPQHKINSASMNTKT